MAQQESFKNSIFEALFNAYLNDEIAELKAVNFDGSKEIDAAFEAFEKRLNMDVSEINALFELKSEYGILCEKTGFICGIKLGASLLKETEVRV